MANLGSFSVDIRAGTAMLQSDLGRANAILERNAKKMADIGTAAGKAFGTAFVVGITAAAALTKQSIDAADAFQNMSQKVGVGVEALSTLAYAAKQSDLELSKLQSGLIKLTKNASDAAQGVGTAVNGFAALGISVKNADGSLKDSDDLLKEVAESLSQYRDGANKTALAVNIFGKAGADMIPLLNEGAEGIRALEDRARSFGLEISGETAARAEQFNDQLTDIGKLAEGLGNDIAADLLPTLNQLAETFIDNGLKARKAGEGNNLLADSMRDLIAGAVIAKNVVEGLTNGIAAALHTATAAATAARKLGQISNPLSMLSEMAQGKALQTPTEILAEFERTATAAMQSAATGIGDSAADIKAALKDIYEPAANSAAAIDANAEAAGRAAPALRDLAKEAAASASAAKAEEAALKALDKEWASYFSILQGVQREHAEVAQSYAEQRAHFDEQARDIQNEITLLGLSGAAREAMAIQIDAERMARDANGNVIEEERKKLETLLKTLSDSREVDSILTQIENFNMDPLLRDIERVGEALKRAFAEAGPPTEEMLEYMKRLQKASLVMKTEVAVGLVGALQSAADGLGSMADEGSEAQRKMQKVSAALAVTQAVLAVITAAQAPPPVGFATMAAMAAAMAGLLSSIGAAMPAFGGGGGPSAQSAEVMQATQGTGTVLGDELAKSESILNATEITADATTKLVGINRGMLRALQTLESGIGSAAGMLARGAGAVDVGPLASGTGGFLGSLPSLGLTDMIFGGSQELIDQGIVIAGGALSDMLNNIVVGAYSTIETDGGWFSGDDIDTNVTDITDEFGQQFALIIASISDTVREGALALGLLPADIERALAAYQVESIRISLMGLSAEEQQAELSAVFSSIFDGLAGSVVPWVEQFQQLGEGPGETLVRVATSVQVTQESMLQLGFALDQTDPEQFAQIAVGLIELSGGIDSFIEGMSTFVNAFATEEHQFAVAQDALTRALEQFGIAVPASRDAMWELMQSLDATTESGREQIATLLRLAGVSDAYYSMLEDQAEDAARAAREAAEAAAEAAELVARAEQQRMDALLAYADIVIGINRSLYELSGATEFRQSLASINAQYQDNVSSLHAQAVAAGLAGARTEDLTAALNLQSAQYARAIQQLERDTQALADQAGYTPLAMIGSQIAELQAEENAAARATENLQNSIREMGRIASDVAAAMLGDMGPLSGAAKADYALRALEDGAISLDAALTAGRDVFASGADFNQFFNEAVAIAGNRRDETPQGVGQVVSLAMRDLLAQQSALQEEAAQAEAAFRARQIAQNVADIAFGRDTDFQTVLDSLGIDSDRLFADLGLDEAGFGALISTLQTEQAELETWLAANVTADGRLIADTMNALFNAGNDPLLVPPTDPDYDTPGGKPPPMIDDGKSARDEAREESQLLRDRIDALILQNERLTGRLIAVTTTGATAAKDRVQIAQRGSMRNDQSRSRSARRGEVVS